MPEHYFLGRDFNRGSWGTERVNMDDVGWRVNGVDNGSLQLFVITSLLTVQPTGLQYQECVLNKGLSIH